MLRMKMHRLGEEERSKLSFLEDKAWTWNSVMACMPACFRILVAIHSLLAFSISNSSFTHWLTNRAQSVEAVETIVSGSKLRLFVISIKGCSVEIE